MKRTSGTAATIIILFFASAAALNAVSVSLSDVVYYDGSGIRLEEFATLDDCPQELIDRVLAAEIKLAPGAFHIIPKRLIRELVARETDEPIVITGPRVIALPASAAGTEKRFFGSLLSFIDGSEGNRETRLVIEAETPFELRGPRVDESGPATDDAPNFRIVSKRTKAGFFEGEMNIEYAYTSGRANGRIRVTVHSFVPVFTSSFPISKGDIFPAHGFDAIEVPASILESEPLRDDARTTSYSARTAIPARSIVYLRQVEKSNDVKAHDSVRLIFHRGTIRLTMPGRSLDSGQKGEAVRVRPVDSESSFTGTITGTREVTVDLEAN